MIRPLLAVAAKVMAFSSRFCKSMMYKLALISCWRDLLMNSFSCAGALLTRPSCLFTSRCKFFSVMRRPFNTLFTVVCTVVRMASIPDFMLMTAGLLSDEVRSKRLRSTIMVLY